MGKSSTQKTSNEPWKESKPYLLGAANEIQQAYAPSKASADRIAGLAAELMPGAFDQAQNGNPALNAGSDYTMNVLGGKYLDQGNPYLQQMIDQTGNDVRNQVQAGMGIHGLTGGSDYANSIAREVAKAGLGMRYGDYQNERNLMGQAASLTPVIAGMNAQQYAPLQSLFGMQQAPLSTAGQYAGSLGGLLGGYQNQSSSKNPSLAETAGGLGSLGLGIAALAKAGVFSDERLKTDIRRVGMTDGGLPVFTYRYKGDPAVRMGVMAQDVEEMQPRALGPEIGGFKTVLYEEVR